MENLKLFLNRNWYIPFIYRLKLADWKAKSEEGTELKLYFVPD